MEIECVCGGETANPTDFIFKALIVKGALCSWKYARCGGTLVTRTHVLTVAHCFKNVKAKELLVIVGGIRRDGTDGVPYRVEQMIQHVHYEKFPMNYDIGIAIVSCS